jgi:aryl-alcohol dehydrogenase-like predicted oxidoreductase
MTVNFSAALNILRHWEADPRGMFQESVFPNWMADVALAEDAVIGSILECKQRGSVATIPEGGLPGLITRAIKRLEALPPTFEPFVVPPLVLLGGTGWGSYGWKYNLEIPRAAVKYGAALIDTAEGYGFGRVEASLGDALGGIGMGDTLLATKVARTHLAMTSVLNAADRSLRRLKVDRLDLYQIHWPHPTVPVGDTLDSMSRLVTAGKVDRVGVSNFSLDQLVAAQIIYPNIASLQVRSAPEDLEQLEKVRLPYCRAAGIQVIGHSPFSQGTIDRNHKDVLDILRGKGIIPIVGTGSVDHLKENLNA